MLLSRIQNRLQNKVSLKKIVVLSLSLMALSACASPAPMGYLPPVNRGYAQPQQMGYRGPAMLNSFGAPNRAPMLGFSTAPASVPNGYYQGAEGQRGAQLLGALSQIVSRHVDLGYDGARDIMFGIADDPTDTDVVACVYTQRQLSGVTNSGDAYRNGQGLNTEHTWPKSKGAAGGPAKGDLHHLFPTDVDTNSKRSSFPFGEVVRVQYENGGSKLGLNAQGQTVFEPRDDHKGNVARALFYFYTVYGRNASTDNFRIEEPVLHKWHAMDPVDALEQRRNNVIFEYQKNRNPYIDRPEFVSLIGRFQ